MYSMQETRGRSTWNDPHLLSAEYRSLGCSKPPSSRAKQIVSFGTFTDIPFPSSKQLCAASKHLLPFARPRTMNALRSSSAFARRSLATPPTTIAPPSFSSARLLSSFSSPTSSTSQRSISSSSFNPRNQRLVAVAASRRAGSFPSPYLTHTRTMASDSKIKVKNPVVELDGDEVRRSSLLL